ncbi:hypothetical protein CerSpe_129430 [Prunus speciosa]
MERSTTDELILHLEESLDLTSINTGVQLVGCIIASKIPNIGAIKNILRKAWSPFGEVKISHVKDNIFSIVAPDDATAAQIVDSSPWSVMRHCFSVKLWPQDMAMEELPTHMVQYWVQAHGLPFNLMNKECARKIGEKIGDVITLEDKGGSRGYLRFRADFDSRNPLVKGFWLPRRDGTTTWVEFCYEKLGDFCYGCGRLSHKLNTCPSAPANTPNEGESGYGNWMAVEPVRPEPILAQFRAPTGGRRRAGEAGDQGHRLTGPNGGRETENIQRPMGGTSQGGQQHMERPSDASRTLLGQARTRRIVGTSTDVAVQGQRIQSTADNPTDASSHPPTVSMPRDLDAHTFGANGLETTETFDNSLALLEHNIPPKLVRPTNWRGPMSFEQVMELRRAQITIGHRYIMDWDSPGPSTRTPRREEYGCFLGEEPTFRNPFDTDSNHSTNISPVKSQHGLNNMGLKRLAQDEWVEKRCSPKKRRKSPQGSPAPLPTAQSQFPSRGCRTRRGRGRGKGKSSPMHTGKRTGGVVIREVSEQQTVDRPNQDDNLMEVAIEEYYGTELGCIATRETRNSGVPSRGGGGWPSTATKSP